MLLKANYDLADKDGKRLDLKDGVYIHHIIMSDRTGRMGGGGVFPKCQRRGGLGGLFGGGAISPKGSMSEHSHGSSAMRYAAAALAAGGPIQKRQGLGFGSILVVKGHEDDPILYAPPNNAFKSGNWFGENPGLTANIEAINYRNYPQDVYLSIDAEYLQMDGRRPADYLNIGFGMMSTGGCGGGLNLSKFLKSGRESKFSILSDISTRCTER
jgi:hypothetical protein